MRRLLRSAWCRGWARLLVAAMVATGLPVPVKASRWTPPVTKDELGNRTSQTDANGHVTRFEYDKLGRQIARILPDGKREEMTYDPAGNLKTRTDFMGRTTTYDQDQNNRLLSKTFSTGRIVEYTYTVTGRRNTATDTRGVTDYGYDTRGRLTQILQPNGNRLDFTYDGNGNRLTITATVNGQSHTTTHTYDDASRLDTVVDHLARTYDFDWDPAGNRARLTHPNGVVTAYANDPLNHLKSLQAQGPLGAVFGQTFTLGPAGNRTRIDEVDGTVRAFGYDDLYRLTGETVTRSTLLDYSRAWTYDDVGNRRAQTTTLGPAGTPSPALQPGVIDYGYDSRDRLLTEVFGGSTTTSYSYDDNGNLVTKSGELTLTWDEENRLVKTEKPGGTVVETAYDVDGVRVQTKTTKPGLPTDVVNYLVDPSGGLSHVVAESDANIVLALYVRGGDDLLAVIRPNGSGGWTSRNFHADGIGSIRRLTDETGLTTDGYSYDAFGVLLAHTGTDPQPYAFAGEPYDPNSSFQYHRARWMDPRTGSFLGIDPFGGRTSDPASLHKYLYAGADPLNRVDPTGLWTLNDWAHIGRAAHQLISIYYDLSGAIIDMQIGNEYKTRPDIRFPQDAEPPFMGRLAGTRGEVYEIKPRRDLAGGILQLQDYILDLTATYPGIFWHPGESISPVPEIWPGELVDPILLSGRKMVVQLQPGGVITYHFTSPSGEEDDSVLSMHNTLIHLFLLASAANMAQQAAIQTQVGVAAMVRF